MSNKRDSRPHDERISDLWTAFGTCKERAIQSGRVNDCSLNKISTQAKVSKTYLTGVRKFKDKDVSKKYTEVNDAIQLWRNNFKANAQVSDERKLINELTKECNNLKNSVVPLLERLDLFESLTEKTPKSLSDKDNEIIILRDKLRTAQTSQSHDSKINDFGIASTIARRIISPDLFRIIGGRYQFGDAEHNQKVINDAYDELDKALSRDLKMRLYGLIGLPCSGKSTWAKSAELCSDRHPVIFDATNLTRVDRLQLVHQVKRFDDLPICCVVFDTPMTEIRKRNLMSRASDKQLPDDALDAMNKRYERPDAYDEAWINQLIVVRDNG